MTPARLKEFLLVAAAALVVTSVLLHYGPKPITYDHQDFPVYADHRIYLEMATGELFDHPIAPLNKRILTPLVAKILPFEIQESFRTVSFIGVCGAGVAIYYLARAFGADRALSFTGMIMFFTPLFATTFVLENFWLVEPLHFLITILLIYSIATGRSLLFALLLMVGVLNKESAMFVAPLYYTLKARSIVDLSVAARTLGVSLPASMVLLALHLIIRQGNDYGYLPTMIQGVQTFYETFSPEVTINYTLGTFGVALCFLPIFAFADRKNLWLLFKFSPFLLLVYSQLFVFSGFAQRLLVLSLPVVIVLAVLGMREIAWRLGARSWYFVPLPLLLLCVNLEALSRYGGYILPAEAEVEIEAFVFIAYLGIVFVVASWSGSAGERPLKATGTREHTEVK